MLATNEKAWLFHRGKWTKIKNPLYGKEAPDAVDRRRSVEDYRRKWWKLGPAYLYPNYTGIVLSTYAYVGTRNLPEFLIWIRAIGMSTTLYAQDLPDLLQVLASLAPIVLTSMFTDLYQRSQKEN